MDQTRHPRAQEGTARVMDSTPHIPPTPSSNLLSDEIYVRNMRTLWAKDSRLAYEIDAWGEPRGVQLEPSREGPPTAAVSDEQGRRVYLHSRYAPVDEARRLIANVKLEGNHCFFINGLGLGYHVKALFERTQGEALLLVCEPDLDILAAAMFSVDLSDVIGAGQCLFLRRLDKDYVHQRLEPFGTMVMLGTQIVSHPPSERIAPEFHQAARTALADYMTYARTSLVTIVANSRITCKNIGYNLPTYLSTPPINVLRNRFAGLPGIVISAGPSIQRNVDQLGALRDRAVLIAVQTMLKPLLRRGITPHFVTSLDFHEISRSFFEGLTAEQLADIHLVAEPKATWHVIDHFAGPVSLLDSEFARMCVGDAL
ncbi:MAG: motility associated factor glycosyltransferase family protein, partial [Phycisphaerae bacterium]|nr:motility associated factor glycosyltransferase family protein [Phycisphaerae bacterium]